MKTENIVLKKVVVSTGKQKFALGKWNAMKYRILFAVATSGFILTTYSTAYGMGCEDILKYGIVDRADVLSVNQTYEKLKEAKNGDFGAIYNTFIIQVKDSSSEEKEYGQVYQQHAIFETINKDIVNAWSGCVGKEGEGFKHYVELVDNKNMNYYYHYAPVGASTTMPDVTSYQPLKLSHCEGSVPQIGTKVSRGWNRMGCQYNPSTGFSISVITSLSSMPETINIQPALSLQTFGAKEKPPVDAIPIKCFASGDVDVAQGEPLSPTNYSLRKDILFGAWSNPQCGNNNVPDSWYMTGIGSCGSGKGDGLKGCEKVEALVH